MSHRPNGAAADRDGAPKARPRASKVLVDDVSKLPANKQCVVKEMLLQGAPAEETAEWINLSEGEGATLQAIVNFYRSNSELQAERVRLKLEEAEQVKRAVGSTAHAMNQLSDALILQALSQDNRADFNFRVLFAQRTKLQIENLILRRRIAEERRLRNRDEVDLLKARARTERERCNLLRSHAKRVEQILEKLEGKQKPDAGSIEQIREIYGLINHPVVQADAENNPEAQV